MKLTGSAKRKQDKEQSEDVNKDIDFILLEDRDFTSNRVSLSVDMNPVKSTPPLPSSSDKSPSAANSGDIKKAVVLSEISQFRELLVVEPLCPLGLVLCMYMDYNSLLLENITIIYVTRFAKRGLICAIINI